MEQTTQIITLTEKAAEKAKQFLEKENKKALRFDVEKGGCSGFRYDISLQDEPKQDDTQLEEKGIKIFVGKESLEFLKGSEVDYFQSLQDSGFKINNPNVKKECGCGHSVG
tara:strand:+ start:9019 stop:9351 length:333 start_codon:yes stop_codon:yes gene_type:complete